MALAHPGFGALSRAGPCSPGCASRDSGPWAPSWGPARVSGCLPGTKLRLRDREMPDQEARTVTAPRPDRGQCRGLGGDRELPAWQRPRVAGLARGAGTGLATAPAACWRKQGRFALALRRVDYRGLRGPESPARLRHKERYPKMFAVLLDI